MQRRSLVTLGETMGRISAGEIGMLDFARTFTLSIAGAETNVAIGAARLGADVTWIGRVGPDAVGDVIERRLAAEGVKAAIVRDRAGTGLMISYRRTNAGTQVDYHRAGSAGSHLCPDDIDPRIVAGAGILHITGITPAISASAREATFAAVEIAHAAGVLISLDVNYRSKLWDAATAAPVLRALAERASIIFAGPEEAHLILDPHGPPAGGVPQSEMPDGGPSTALDLAHALARLGPAEAIVKDGSRGCVAVIDGVEHVVPAISVAVVDPIGAGDAFVAGYLAEHLDGCAAGQRLRTAVRTGAYAVTMPSDCEGLPRRHELDQFSSVEDVTR